MQSSRKVFKLVVVALALGSVASSLGAVSASTWQGEWRSWDERPRAATPEDRYAMAGGCYAIGFTDGWRIVRWGDTFRALPADVGAAEPFYFQATDLGSYLLFTDNGSYLAASEGALAKAAYTATRSAPGAMAGGVTLEQTDAAADTLARSAPNQVAGRGASVVAASAASELADWTIEGDGPFEITLPSANRTLAHDSSGFVTLAPGTDHDPSVTLELTEGCMTFPEIEVNVDGDLLGGQVGFQEVRGFMDLHLHMMAFEFLGGRARCGRPWHRYGVTQALVDCPDHQPGGQGAVLEQVLSGPGPHNTDGWPTFTGWPRYNSLTHEQIYYKWMERAWRGGLRMFMNLLVDNNQLCKIYPFKRNSCNEMDGVRLQAQRIRELERYIDAQNGGPGEGWFRIVTDPFEARRVINEGRLAVILGVEVSVPLDCGITLDIPRCDPAQVEQRLDAVYDLGVRQMELVNKFDNAFSGVAGDGGTTGIIVNQGNLGETGRFWQMETCDEQDGEAHDKRQMNFHDDAGTPDQITGRDAFVGGVLQTFGTSGAVPLYPEGPHCNVRDLSDLGEQMIRGLVDRGMIFDPDHMSARARTQAVDLIDELGYSGIVSSHGWADDTIYPRIYELGGVVTPYGGSSSGFVNNWVKHRAWADDRFFFGFGYGADTNGFGSQGGPRGASNPNKVTYPFTGFGGTTISQQRSGTRVYDVNTDGVAHYGLYPDWLQDLQQIAGPQILDDMARGPEAYLQMWERAIGIAPNACRDDIDDLDAATIADVALGSSAQQVLESVGQPEQRTIDAFTYCVEGGLTGRVSFDAAGTVTATSVS